MPDLRLVGVDSAAVHRRFPVAWDGHTIRWGRPDSPLVELVLSHPVPEPCGRCGRTRHLVAGGSYTDGEREFWRDDAGQLHSHVAYHRITLFRCWQCGHDEVLEHDSRTMWDLDDTDYGPEGSWPTQEALL